MQQVLVVVSSLLAGLSSGCAIGYTSVLLQQLGASDSSVQVDADTLSWIGSIHGLTGIPSTIMPAFMQWKGRRLAFIMVCVFSIVGWITASSATNASTILLGEFIIGFAGHSLMAVVLLSMSEMVSPQYRNGALVSFFVIEAVSLALVEIAGKYLHWKTLSLIISAPVSVALLMALMWPESPSWLAYKGKFDKCEEAFKRLRGTSIAANMELEELILAQKENIAANKWDKQSTLKQFWHKLKSRDFYMPAIHIFLLLALGDWSGILVVLIYSSKIIESTTHNKDAVFYGTMILNSSIFVCFIANIILMRYFSQKKVFLTSAFFTVGCLLGLSLANYSQIYGFLPEDSFICVYFLVGYMMAMSLGLLPIVYSTTNELMPVKHRDIGGPMGLIFACILDTSSLKLAPQMFKSMNIWGTTLFYASNAIICTLLAWKYVPETKGRTLQQLEDYYAYGSFEKPRRLYTEECIDK